MGIKLFSRDTYDSPATNNTTPNPNPSNWEILDSEQFDNHLVVRIRYPDCTNYEGVKILVYENMNISALRQSKKIDPHFSDNKQFKSPIARFEPTDRGLEMAKLFCQAMCGRLLND